MTDAKRPPDIKDYETFKRETDARNKRAKSMYDYNVKITKKYAPKLKALHNKMR